MRVTAGNSIIVAGVLLLIVGLVNESPSVAVMGGFLALIGAILE